MTTPDEGSRAVIDGIAKVAAPPVHAPEPSTPKNPRDKNIHVSPAVLDAAAKDGEELLRSLGTTSGGLTQAEAEERGRKTGPNEVAQEKPPGGPLRLLK